MHLRTQRSSLGAGSSLHRCRIVTASRLRQLTGNGMTRAYSEIKRMSNHRDRNHHLRCLTCLRFRVRLNRISLRTFRILIQRMRILPTMGVLASSIMPGVQISVTLRQCDRLTETTRPLQRQPYSHPKELRKMRTQAVSTRPTAHSEISSPPNLT